jgi:hypothetical protein
VPDCGRERFLKVGDHARVDLVGHDDAAVDAAADVV